MSERKKSRRRWDSDEDDSADDQRHKLKPSKKEQKELKVEVEKVRSTSANESVAAQEDMREERELMRNADELGERDEDQKKEKKKANFGLSGALNEDVKSGKMYNGVVMKWSEPPDAATPPGPGWRLYVFNKDNLEETLFIHRQSAYLISRDEKIADILVNDETCSRQHAVIQFRLKTKQPPPGSLDKPKYYIRPYLMDLESTHGTILNKSPVEPSRYIELLEKDVIRFGESPLEYVVMKSSS